MLSVFVLGVLGYSETGWIVDGLHGRVKEWVKIEYDVIIKIGKIEKTTNSMEIKTYDEDGNQIKWAVYKSDMTLDKNVVYKYEVGILIEKVEYKSDGALHWKDVLVYDEDGNQIEEAKYEPNGALFSKLVYKYDEDGNLIEEAWYLLGGSGFTSKNVYKYDEDGSLIENAYYNFDGGLIWKEVLIYNEIGNISEGAKYKWDGSLYSKNVYKYDGAGNKIEDAEYKPEEGTGETELNMTALTEYKITYW